MFAGKTNQRRKKALWYNTLKKTFIVLDMYEDLLAGSKLNSKTCNDKYGISESTFYRYISTIKEFVWERHLQEVVYNTEDNTYKILKNFKIE